MLGPEDDTHQVMDLGIIRSNLYFLTQDPSGRLHETAQGTTEPAEWTINEVAANCGTVSAFSMTRSQADDSSAAGGEEWFAWFSSTGIRIFGGEAPDKISQEIQRPIGQTFPGAPSDLGALNVAAQLTVWGLNDPDQKTMWFGIPTGTATAPSVIWQLSYLGLDSASAIVSSPPIHKSLSGRLVATDLGRKWAPWQRTMNGGALMYRQPGAIEPVFFGGSGSRGNSGRPVYIRSIVGLTSISIAEGAHNQGTEPYVVAIDQFGNVVDVAIVNALSGAVPTGNLTIGFGGPFTGTIAVGQGGTYAQTVTGATSVTITRATHGQGATPYVIGISSAGNFVYPSVVNAISGGLPTGNLTIAFAPVFTGIIIVGSGTSFVQSQNSTNFVSIPLSVHNQGATPYIIAIDSAGNFVSPAIVNNSGNLSFSFAPAFTGVLVVGSSGGNVAYGNVYSLDQGLFTDDDYGQMFPRYTSYALPDRDQEQQLQLGGHMKLVSYTHSFVTGIGNLTISILYESLANVWGLNGVYELQQSPLFDLEWGGGNAQAQRFFFQYAMSPLVGQTDVAFSLTTLVVAMRKCSRMPVRGSYP